MRSIGNDIVDLQLAKTQSNWQRKGFLEKQFTAEEQEVILNSDNPFLQVWLFWAMKEAAYKCYVLECKKRFFAPKKLSCKIRSESKGIVMIESKKYNVNYIITGNYVYALAFENEIKKMVSDYFLIENNKQQSQIINQKLVSHFDANTFVKKDKFGAPHLFCKEKKLPISISKSHHGNYGAYAFLKY